MAAKIDDLWILTETGVVLFDHRHIDIDPSLFGAMMSALNNFANAISEDGMMGFELNHLNSVIHIFKQKHLLFVASCSKKLKEKKIQKMLKAIATQFFEKYQKFFASDDFIHSFDGEITAFSDFGNDIDDYLVD